MASTWRAALKALTAPLGRAVPEGVFRRLYFLAKLGYWPNLRQPRTFSELQVHRAMHDRDPRLGVVADKYLVRAYVEERVGADHLLPLVDVLGAGDRLEISTWPERVVMKATHASGWIRFVERDRADVEELQALVRRWTTTSYAEERHEWWYAMSPPRVIVEPDLSRDGLPPPDYKVFVFDGRPRMIVVDQDRFGAHTRWVCDHDWRRLAVRYDHPQPAQDVPRPQRLPEILALAARLGEGFPFLRVDTYVTDDRVVVGELTNFPDSGPLPFKPRSFDAELGSVWREARPIHAAWHRNRSIPQVDTNH